MMKGLLFICCLLFFGCNEKPSQLKWVRVVCVGKTVNLAPYIADRHGLEEGDRISNIDSAKLILNENIFYLELSIKELHRVK